MAPADDLSRVTARTRDGPCVALAGLPDDMRVVPLEEPGIDVRTVDELGAVKRLPHPIDIFIPYRLKPDSAVVIARS